MDCPYCGSEMNKGILRSRGCNFFLRMEKRGYFGSLFALLLRFGLE